MFECESANGLQVVFYLPSPSLVESIIFTVKIGCFLIFILSYFLFFLQISEPSSRRILTVEVCCICPGINSLESKSAVMQLQQCLLNALLL